MTIKVFFADDHQLMAEGFKVMLKDFRIEVVEVAYTLDGLVQRVAETRPDVLVIDVRFEARNSQLDGLDICERILADDPKAKIVVFSQFDDEHIIEKTYKLGIFAFVRKDENIDVLVEAIETAHKGKKFISPAVAQQLAWLSIETPSPAKLLDDKELRAFKLVADGASIADVANEMHLSTKTAGIIVKSVKQKLEIDNQADFTKLAIRFGLTNLELRTRS